MLRHFEAGLGPSISTMILSKVAVALFVLFAAVCSPPLANPPPLAITPPPRPRESMSAKGAPLTQTLTLCTRQDWSPRLTA